MSSTPPEPYRLALEAGHILARALAPLVPQCRAAVTARASSAAAFASWGAGQRAAAPMVLLHAASAGELRLAEPLLRRLRARHPEWQLAATYTSSSAVAVASELPLDLHGFLPWDTPASTSALLEALCPDLVVVSKLDLWPELVHQAVRRDVPVALVGAMVRPDSSRLRWPARQILRRAYGAVAAVAAAAPADAERLVRLGVPFDRIEVAGDPRADAVLERLGGQVQSVPTAPLLVAGSTWPEDEDRLLAAFRLVRARKPDARLLLAPHQPTPDHLARLERRAKTMGLPRPRPPGSSTPGPPLMVEDRVGRLAFLYGLGCVAYVGGGFGRAGLHSVFEPAAWGVPVLVGPRWRQSADAAALAEGGGLVAVETAGPAATETLATEWLRLLEDEGSRAGIGLAARRTVQAGVGAADRCAALVESLVTSRPRRRRLSPRGVRPVQGSDR